PSLREFFRDHEELKNADYRRLFGLTRHASLRELKRLVEDGFLQLKGERKGAHYRPSALMGREGEI
ncbi:MAG: hypothetical protein IIC35_06535, partial [Gemmatimonadetes bacterium]|nr:hypothetical protein [Gemmatimonadota bacterium]